MSPDKAMSLLYLADNVAFDVHKMFAGVWTPEWYYLVRQMPLAEMRGVDVLELAEELIQLTISADWCKQQRRPVMCGDIVCRGRDPWMYVKTEDLDKTTSRFSRIRLVAWPDYSVVSLPRDAVERIICTQSTCRN